MDHELQWDTINETDELISIGNRSDRDDSDRYEDEEIENSVSKTLRDLAPLSSISEVTLNNMDLGSLQQLTDDITL